MERRTRSRKHQVSEDKVSVKTSANATVPQQILKEPKRIVTSNPKQKKINSNKEHETPKSSIKIAARKTSKRADVENKKFSKAPTDGKSQANDDSTIGKSVQKRDISNSRFREEIPQNKEKSMVYKATINDSSSHLDVSELSKAEEPGLVKNFQLPKFDQNPILLDQSLPTTSHVSETNVLFEDLSTGSPVNEEDSFLYDITSRSPAKPVPRTEDPIATLETDLNVLHEIPLPGKINEYHILQEPSPRLISTSKINSLSKYNYSLPINPCLKSPIKTDTIHPVKEIAQQGLGSSLQTKKTEKSQMSRVSSMKSSDQSQKPLKQPVCKSKSSTTICSPIKSHSTHSSYFRPTKVDSHTVAANSHRKVVTKLRTKPNTSMSSVDVFTRLSIGTPKHHSYSSKTNNSTLHISKERQTSTSTSTTARDGNFSSLSNNRASREGSSGTPYRQPAVRSNEAKPLTLQKPNITPNSLKSPSNLIPLKKTLAPHHLIQIPKQHHKTKPLEDIKQNSLPRVNPSQNIKMYDEAKINTVLLVRHEAAKRGRQAIQEWAEKQMAKT